MPSSSHIEMIGAESNTTFGSIGADYGVLGPVLGPTFGTRRFPF